MTAANSVGSQSITELVDVANPGVPGAITVPANGAALSGTSYNVVFTPRSPFAAAGFTITQVYVSCPPYGNDTITPLPVTAPGRDHLTPPLARMDRLLCRIRWPSPILLATPTPGLTRIRHR